MTRYAVHPQWLFVRVRYRNGGTAPIEVTGYASHRYEMTPAAGRGEPAFWSYQGLPMNRARTGCCRSRPGYRRANFLGMNDADYGGGTPVVDVWRRDAGLAIGHVELLPKLVSLPVERAVNGNARVALTAARPRDAFAGPGIRDAAQLRGRPSR